GGNGTFGIVVEDGEKLIKRTVPEARATGLIGDALAQGLAGRMRMDVDETRQQQPPRTIDLGIGRLRIALANEDNLAAADRQIDIAPIDVARAFPIPGNEPGRIAKDGGVGHRRLDLCCNSGGGARRGRAYCRLRQARWEAPRAGRRDVGVLAPLRARPSEPVAVAAPALDLADPGKARALPAASRRAQSRKAISALEAKASRRRTNSVSARADALGSACTLSRSSCPIRATRLRGNSVMPRPAPTHLKIASMVPNSSRRGDWMPRLARKASSRCR